jgi:hypothetical protein
MSDEVDDLMAWADRMPVPEQPIPWYLDVDGVLNLAQATAFDWPEYRQGHVVDDNEWAFLFSWSTGLVEIINRLVQRGIVTVRWLTSWDHRAPAKVAPLLGLKVGSVVAAEESFDDAAWWKLKIIREALTAGEFFIWTDDEIWDHTRASQENEFVTPERAIVICPSESAGLTPTHIAQILAALERVSTTAGSTEG